MSYDYDVVIIGGGAAGLSAASKAIENGVRTAIIERDKLGGACTWSGCVPSKALLKSAKVFADTQQLMEYGIAPGSTNSYDTRNVMTHVRSMIMKMGTHDDPDFYASSGIKVLFGRASFKDRNTVQVDGDTVTARNFLICTGSRSRLPPVEGLVGVDYLTTDTLFDLGLLPGSIAILGGGSNGVEIGQALALLGVHVTIIETAERILPREDRELAVKLEHILQRQGLHLHAGTRALTCSPDANGVRIILEDSEHHDRTLTAERVLVAAGRVPATEGLSLENAGVEYNDGGIIVDRSMRTSAENIYACGDVASPYKFTHVAGYQAGIVMNHLLFDGNRTMDYSAVPWCTYTLPELAHFGPTEEEARASSADIQVYRADYTDNDRALTDREDIGVVKVITDPAGRIIGAHILGAKADEIIHEYILARSAGLSLGEIGKSMHIYPTIAGLIKETSRQYRVKERLRKKESAAVT